MEIEIQVLFYVIAVLVIAVFWMKVVEWFGWGLTPVLLLIEEKLEKLEEWFSSPKDLEKKDRPLQAGDLCPKCEKGYLRMEYSPLHPLMTTDTGSVAQWPYDLICSFCGEVTAGKY